MKKTNINNLFSIRPLKPKIFIQDKNHVIIQEKKIPINSTKPIVISAPSLPLIKSSSQSTFDDKMAILIGCEYVNYALQKKLDRLLGCHNDVRLFQQLLEEKYKYNKSNIIVLSDETKSHTQPTTQNILKTLKDTVEKCKTQNIKKIVFYYSGHGTQQKSNDKDELDGKDECMVSCDFLTNGLITDDVLHDVFWTKIPQHVQVIGVFDCCNSGTLFDLPFTYNSSTNVVLSTLRKQDTINNGNNSNSNNSNNNSNNSNSNSNSNNTSLIMTLSGCLDMQTSASAYNLERNVKWEGAMSFCLRQVLIKYDYKPISLSILIEEIRTCLKKYNFTQVPQLAFSKKLNPSDNLFTF